MRAANNYVTVKKSHEQQKENSIMLNNFLQTQLLSNKTIIISKSTTQQNLAILNDITSSKRYGVSVKDLVVEVDFDQEIKLYDGGNFD